MESTGGGWGQKGVDLQKSKLHMILHMLHGLHFACSPFEIEKEFGVMVLGKAVHLDVVLDEVQRVGKV
jgi:hypothetical protein